MNKEKIVFSGHHFKIIHKHVELGNGKQKVFEYAWRRDGTRMIAIKEEHLILLTREYRFELDDYDWKLPGGKLDNESEDPSVAVKREFKEETGYEACDLEYLGKTIPFSTIMYRIHFYLTKNPKEGRQELDDGEYIRVYWVPLTKAVAMALSGEIQEEISALMILKLANEIFCGKRVL